LKPSARKGRTLFRRIPVGTDCRVELCDNLNSILVTRNIAYQPDLAVTLTTGQWHTVHIRVADRVEVTVDGVKLFNPVVKGNNFNPPKDCER